MTTETQAPKMSLAELQALVLAQAEIIKNLQTLTAPKVAAETREMTDADARRVIAGDLKDMKHKDAAKLLGLSYGQIYSARLEFTFKAIHKAIKAEGLVNPWIK